MKDQLSRSTLFPYTTLFRSVRRLQGALERTESRHDEAAEAHEHRAAEAERHPQGSRLEGDRGKRPGDRKSTRLNSSHMSISYAVFCLKKKEDQLSLF